MVVPLAAHALLERRARRISRRLGLTPPDLRSRLGVAVAIVAVAALLAIAAAQPVVAGTSTSVGRADAEVYFLFDTSRSMLARRDFGAPDRLARAEQIALRLRQSLADVPVGIASLTDRVLPHLFPTLDAQVFASTLQSSIGIERPPPAGDDPLATDFTQINVIAANNYFKRQVSKRLLVVFSDGESGYFDDLVLAEALHRQNVHVLFVYLWNVQEKIFSTAKTIDPGYRPDPESRRWAQRLATAGDGSVVSEADESSLRAAAKRFLGSGPATMLREQRTRVSLAPYVALAALLPLGFVFVRRNL